MGRRRVGHVVEGDLTLVVAQRERAVRSEGEADRHRCVRRPAFGQPGRAVAAHPPHVEALAVERHPDEQRAVRAEGRRTRPAVEGGHLRPSAIIGAEELEVGLVAVAEGEQRAVRRHLQVDQSGGEGLGVRHPVALAIEGESDELAALALVDQRRTVGADRVVGVVAGAVRGGVDGTWHPPVPSRGSSRRHPPRSRSGGRRRCGARRSAVCRSRSAARAFPGLVPSG